MSGPVRAALLAALSFGLSAVLSTTPAWGQKSFPCDSTGACLDTIARRYAAARLLLVAADLPTEADWTAATGPGLPPDSGGLHYTCSGADSAGTRVTKADTALDNWYKRLSGNLGSMAKAAEVTYQRTGPPLLPGGQSGRSGGKSGSPFADRVASSVLMANSDASQRAELGQRFRFLFDEWSSLRSEWEDRLQPKVRCASGTVDQLTAKVDSLSRRTEWMESTLKGIDSLLRAKGPIVCATCGERGDTREAPRVGVAVAGYAGGAAGAGGFLHLPIRGTKAGVLVGANMLLASGETSSPSDRRYRPGAELLLGAASQHLVVTAGPMLLDGGNWSWSGAALVRGPGDMAWGVGYARGLGIGVRAILLPRGPGNR